MPAKQFASPEEVVSRIQAGSASLRDALIEDNLPEIRQIVRRITRSFAVDDSEGYSIALEMFNLAITRYRPELQVPFINFAMLIIRNRLFDWCQRQKSARRALNFTDCETADGTPLADRLADPSSDRFCQNLEIKESLISLEYQLEQFGFSLDGMAERFPKHRDSRLFCIRVARQLASDRSLLTQTLQKRRLPVAELASRCQCPVKTIDKNRANIIFMALLLNSDLDLIQSYVAAYEKEETK